MNFGKYFIARFAKNFLLHSALTFAKAFHLAKRWTLYLNLYLKFKNNR